MMLKFDKYLLISYLNLLFACEVIDINNRLIIIKKSLEIIGFND